MSFHKGVRHLWSQVPSWSLVPCPFWGKISLVSGPSLRVGGRVSRGRVTPTPTPQSGDHCSGRYASYWNAVLFTRQFSSAEAELSNFPFLIYLPIPSIFKGQKSRRLNFMGLERQYILVRGITLHSSYCDTSMSIHYRPPKKLREGDVFSHVFSICHFIYRGCPYVGPSLDPPSA